MIGLDPGLFIWDEVDLKEGCLQPTDRCLSRYVPVNDVVHEISSRHRASGLEYPFTAIVI